MDQISGKSRDVRFSLHITESECAQPNQHASQATGPFVTSEKQLAMQTETLRSSWCDTFDLADQSTLQVLFRFGNHEHHPGHVQVRRRDDKMDEGYDQ